MSAMQETGMRRSAGNAACHAHGTEPYNPRFMGMLDRIAAFPRLSLLTGMLLFEGSVAWAQPVNDDFINRTALPSGPAAAEGNTFLSTTEPGEVLWNQPTNTVASGTTWWSWIAPA